MSLFVFAKLILPYRGKICVIFSLYRMCRCIYMLLSTTGRVYCTAFTRYPLRQLFHRMNTFSTHKKKRRKIPGAFIHTSSRCHQYRLHKISPLNILQQLHMPAGNMDHYTCLQPEDGKKNGQSPFLQPDRCRLPDHGHPGHSMLCVHYS